jgi:hypothetical protein
MSPTARRTLATKQLVTLLGTNAKLAETAALEVINELMTGDEALGQSLMHRYNELVALAAPKPKPVAVPKVKVSAGSGPARRTTVEKLDPYQLVEDVGRDHLRASLAGTTQRRLRSAVDAVITQNPGAKPTNRTQNEAMIDFIVEYVAGPGY